MSELFRELEEDMRAERYRTLWKKYGSTLIGVSLAIVLGTAIGAGWKSYQHTQDEKHTAALVQAVDGASQEGLRNLMEDAGGRPQGSIAALLLAQQYETAGKHEDALKMYADVAEHAKDPALRNLAHALLLRSGGELQKSISSDAPFAALVAEAKAWQLLEQGNKDEAMKAFTVLKNGEHVPPAMRSRAGDVLAYLSEE